MNRDQLREQGYVVTEGEVGTIAALNTVLTDELKAEGTARDIIRHGQELRKQANYALNDRIVLVLRTDSGDLKHIIDAQAGLITQALQADHLITEGPEDASADVTINGQRLHVGVKKA